MTNFIKFINKINPRGQKSDELNVRKAKWPKINYIIPNKASRRVIAPYVKVVRKVHKTTSAPESLTFKKHLERKPSVLLQDQSSFLTEHIDLPSLLHESSEVLRIATNAHGVALYLIDNATGEIYQSQLYYRSLEPRVRWKIEQGTIVAAHVAFNKELIMIEDVIEDERFPMGIGHKDELTRSVLCVPVVTPHSGVCAVIELTKQFTQDPFTKKDSKIVALMTSWMGAAIHQNSERVVVHKRQELNIYLLELIKIYFEESVPFDKIISELIKFVKLTLGAEKSCFYLLCKKEEDEYREEMFADVYLDGIEDNEEVAKTKNAKLTPKEHEIVMTVAEKGETVNVQNASNDPRVNKQVAVETGFIVKNVLCMCVKGHKDITGIIEVINKKDGCFMKPDEILLEVFITYFSLIIEYSDISLSLKKQEKVNVVNADFLDRQVGPCDHDYDYLLNKYTKIKLPNNFFDFRWALYDDIVGDVPLLLFLMFKDLFEPEELDESNLAKFILSVRKYDVEKLPFHNFERAFGVCHFIYNLIKRCDEFFTPTEKKAMMIAGLAHSVNRSNATNSYLAIFNDEIAQVYPDSPWQQYHILITDRLLEIFPPFKNMSAKQHKLFIKEVHKYILNTDIMNNFFAKQYTPLREIVKSRTFDVDNPEHMNLLKAVIFVVACFSCLVKPHSIGRKWAENMYREMCLDGKKLKKILPNDRILIEMYARENFAFIAEQQIDYLNTFVMNAADCLQTIIPNTKDIADSLTDIRNTWQVIIELRGRKTWKHEDSYQKKRVLLHY